MNHMKQALERRRGKGIDLTIILGGEEADRPEDETKTDMAPENKSKEMEEMGESPEFQMAEKEGMDEAIDAISKEKESEEDPFAEMMDIPDHEKSDLMGRNPRSLHERAMQHHLMKSKK